MTDDQQKICNALAKWNGHKFTSNQGFLSHPAPDYFTSAKDTQRLVERLPDKVVICTVPRRVPEECGKFFTGLHDGKRYNQTKGEGVGNTRLESLVNALNDYYEKGGTLKERG